MKKLSGKGGHRHLDNDESADWDYTSRSIEPLKRKKNRVTAGMAAEPESLPPRPKVGSSPLHQSPKSKAAAGVAKAPAKKVPETIAEFDRKSVKRLRSGRIEIEARIDLHGMRQDEAHSMLRQFLVRAQERGKRWVLVITGKGKALESSDDDFSPRERGVLKRNVPRWLEERDLRPLVVSYTTAAIGHGGEGALYVHLRKRV